MSKIRVIAVCAGFGLEAYDWGMYPLLLSYFGPDFFGPDLQRSLISGFAVFAVGFVTRPFGGLILGRFADTRGRKPAMLVCLAGAGVAALGMGLTPSTAVFSAAPALVVGWRALLGFFFGGEAPLGHSYVYEMTTPGRRGAGGSWLPAAAGVGGIFANLLVLALVWSVGSDGMTAGYWRIPFLVGAFGSFLFAALRGGLTESRQFQAHRHDAYSWWAARRQLALSMLAVAGVTIGASAVIYLWGGLTTTYAISVLQLDDASVLTATMSGALLITVLVPLFGRLGDRVGCRFLLSASALAMAIAVVPLQYGLEYGGVAGFWGVIMLADLLLAPLLAMLPSVLAGLVPGRYRVAAEGVPYTLTTMLFGGTVPMLKQLTADHPALIGCYVALLLLITVGTLQLVGRRGGESPEGAVPVVVPAAVQP
jgi:MHS family alpha-ketoglutarate permease-like MFS transporter